MLPTTNKEKHQMKIREADEQILSGEWSKTVEYLADACEKYAKEGPVVKDSYIYNLWIERASLLREAMEVGQ